MISLATTKATPSKDQNTSHLKLCVYMYMSMCICFYAQMCTCVYVYMCICIYVSAYVHVYIYMYILCIIIYIYAYNLYSILTRVVQGCFGLYIFGVNSNKTMHARFSAPGSTAGQLLTGACETHALTTILLSAYDTGLVRSAPCLKVLILKPYSMSPALNLDQNCSLGDSLYLWHFNIPCPTTLITWRYSNGFSVSLCGPKDTAPLSQALMAEL